MTWTSIIIAGFITYLTRMTMIILIRRETLSDKMKDVLAYVPSAVFPAIIFPGIFFNEYGIFVNINDPKILAATVSIIVGYFSKNVIGTILAGLISYWFIIFLM